MLGERKKSVFFFSFCSGSRWLKIDLCNFWPSKSFRVDAAVTRLHRSQWVCSSHSPYTALLPSLPPSQSVSQSPELFINDHLRIIKAQHNHSSDYHVCAWGWGLGESSDPIRGCRMRTVCDDGKWGRKNWCCLTQVPPPSIYLPITNICPFIICWSISWMNE